MQNKHVLPPVTEPPESLHSGAVCHLGWGGGPGWRGSPHPTALGSALTLLLPLSLQCTVQVKLELGHRYQLRKKPTTEGFTHDWMVSRPRPRVRDPALRGEGGLPLHDSFPKPKRGECPPWGAAGLNSLASTRSAPARGYPHLPFPLSCELGCQDSLAEVVTGSLVVIIEARPGGVPRVCVRLEGGQGGV